MFHAISSFYDRFTEAVFSAQQKFKLAPLSFDKEEFKRGISDEELAGRKEKLETFSKAVSPLIEELGSNANYYRIAAEEGGNRGANFFLYNYHVLQSLIESTQIVENEVKKIACSRFGSLQGDAIDLSLTASVLNSSLNANGDDFFRLWSAPYACSMQNNVICPMQGITSEVNAYLCEGDKHLTEMINGLQGFLGKIAIELQWYDRLSSTNRG